MVFLALGTIILSIAFGYLLNSLYQMDIAPQWLWNFVSLRFLPRVRYRVAFAFLLGVALLGVGVWNLGRAIIAPFRNPDVDLAETILTHKRRNKGPRIVTIGGGTGMPTLLRGLTPHTRNITAIVTVADDGGSSGRLREELGVLPPGDFRNNLAALSRDESLMAQLMQYRFGGNDSSLGGHAFGNLLIAALTQITGSFDEALFAMDRVLSLRGRVMPSTMSNVNLVANIRTPNGLRTIEGESAIPKADGKIVQVFLNPPDVQPYPDAIRAILDADLIILGPGSLYTSVLPNLLVTRLSQALAFAQAPKVYICNVAIQKGETDGYSVADHVDAIVQHSHPDCIDIVVANNRTDFARTAGGGDTQFVVLDTSPHAKIIAADLVDEARPWRHDSTKLAEVIVTMITNSKNGT